MTRFWEIKAAANAEADLYIYDEIGDAGFFGESVSAKEFVSELRSIGRGVKTINLRVNSPGGSVWDGMAIKNALREHPAKVRATVEGIAGSIATVIIAGSADHVVMGEETRWIIHNPYGGVLGDAREMRRTADALDKVKSDIMDVYQRQTGQDRDHLSNLMDAETWFTADEAVAFGFADSVTKDVPRIAARVTFDLEKVFHNTPPELTRSAQAKARLQSVLAKA